ncbi:MAG: chemotaxis protein CheW [Hyphomicrobiales bacterium]|nr:chemotaxis protein CheW [Hyphomicrobiales bacterium]
MDDLLKEFLTETSDHIEAAGSQIVLFERDPSNAQLIAGIFRLVHTIKGTCGFLGLPRLSRLAHAAEAMISHLRDGGRPETSHVSLILTAIDQVKFIIAELERTGAEPEGEDTELIARLTAVRKGEAEAVVAAIPPLDGEPAEVAGEINPPMAVTDVPVTAPEPAARHETVRVSVDTLERMMMLVSELVLTRNQLLDIVRRRDDETLNQPLIRLSSLTSDLQDSVMRSRMQPVGRLFAGLPRLVRELASELGKPLQLATLGAETEVDRQIIELIRDPLTHLIRNCADHGIEPPAERAAARKAETGTIRVSASHEAGQIIIEIYDDGRGLDVGRIRAKAMAMRLAPEADIARMNDEEICRFIFAPGFSTASAVTSVSGRGVGMDVVRENLEALGGSVALSTTAGQGTSFFLKIPLTLAIAPALIIEGEPGQRFALPQHWVVEVVGLDEAGGPSIEWVQGASLLRLREAVIPVINLCELLMQDGKGAATSSCDRIVVMRLRDFTFGLRVRGVADVQEVVVKPLGSLLGPLPLFSGNTILGDGAVVLILNPGEIAQRLGLERVSDFRVHARAEEFVIPATRTRMILFSAGPGPLKCLPLSVISRVEQFDTAIIQKGDNCLVVPFQGRLMPLLMVGDGIDPTAAPQCPVLVMAVGGEPMGLIISAIVDIVDVELDIEIAGHNDRVLGMAQIGDAAVEVLDGAWFMNNARPQAFARGQVKRFHVLLVDDKSFFLDMLSPVLSVAGYDVTTTDSAAQAIMLMERGAKFEAIITDTDMPDMDGYALARTLIADQRWTCPPILALASYAGPIIQQAAKASGMVTAVGKFDRRALLKSLSDVLDQATIAKQTIETDLIARLHT